jgi:hypothetical protein
VSSVWSGVNRRLSFAMHATMGAINAGESIGSLGRRRLSNSFTPPPAPHLPICRSAVTEKPGQQALAALAAAATLRGHRGGPERGKLSWHSRPSRIRCPAVLRFGHRTGGLQVSTAALMGLPLSSVTPLPDTITRAGPFNIKSRFALKWQNRNSLFASRSS